MFKFVVLLALLLPFGSVFAQTDSDSRLQAPGNAAPPMLQRPYEAVKDFLNLYGFVDETYDSNGYYVYGGNSGSGTGVVFGGGATGYQEWSTGVLELSYRGSYHDYQTKSFPDGNEQNLSLLFRKDFTRRLSLTLTEAAGILDNGGSVYSSSPNVINPAVLVQTNPFNFETRFTGTNLSLTYQKTVRLSFHVTGSYALTRYSSAYSYGSNDISGVFGANYRLTRRTTVGADYSYSHFVYKNNTGGTNLNSVFASVTHVLASRWIIGGSGGFSRPASNGTLLVPYNVQIGQQLVTFIGPGKYSYTSILPYYQGTVTYNIRHDSVSASGGESVSPGNGLYLASRTVGFNGLWMHNLRRSNLSVAGYFTHLSSVSSNTHNDTDVTRGIDCSYSYNVIHHVGLTARYDFLNYSSLGSYGGRADNRFTFGVYVTTKDIPIGLF